MSICSSHNNILKGEDSFLVKSLWERLNPSQWPIRIDDFPPGSALVGGAVRDGLLGKIDKRLDLDFIVPSRAIKLAQNFAAKYGGTCIILDDQRDIARLALSDWIIDISSQDGLTIEEDLNNRDFTLNAIALTLDSDSKIIDPLSGLGHLNQGILIAISQKNLINDPLRMLRGLRLKAEFNFRIELQTIFWIKANHLKLLKVSPERIQSEIEKLLCADWADEVIPLIREYGLLNLWLQPAKSLQPSSENLSNAKNFTQEELSLALPLSRLTSLISDDGLTYLRFSRNKCKCCKLLRKWKSRNDGLAFKTLPEFERLQLHKELENFLPAIILELSDSDQIDWIKRWRNQKDPLFHPSSPINGNVLKEAFGLSPGPKVGRLLEYLCHEKAFNRLQNQQEVFKVASNWLQRNEASL